MRLIIRVRIGCTILQTSTYDIGYVPNGCTILPTSTYNISYVPSGFTLLQTSTYNIGYIAKSVSEHAQMPRCISFCAWPRYNPGLCSPFIHSVAKTCCRACTDGKGPDQTAHQQSDQGLCCPQTQSLKILRTTKALIRLC